MKIAIFTRSTIDHFTSGGMETHLLNLSEGLVSIGHSVDIITTSYPGKDMVESRDVNFLRNGVEYFFIGGTTPGLRPISLYESILLFLRVYKRSRLGEGGKNFYIESLNLFTELSKSRKYDIVLSQSTMGYGITGKVSVPICSIIHGTISGEIKNRLRSSKTIKNWIRFFILDLPNWIIELYAYNNRFYRKIDGVISVSNSLASEFRKEKKHIHAIIDVIYNGVDSDKFSPALTKPPEPFTLLNVGRMEREKGIDTIINAVRILLDKGLDLRLVIVGTGVHLDEFKLLASEKKILDKVFFKGEISNDKITDIYKTSHLFVIPSRRNEGHPMVLSESLCSGLPIISSNKGGLKDIIINGVNGYILDTNEAPELAEKISVIYNDRKLLRVLSRNARKIGVEKYSKKAMIEKYDLVLNKIHDEYFK